MNAPLRVPYTQQFSVSKTPLQPLVGILRQYQGKRAELRQAIASAFFKDSTDADGLAGNTLISLKAHGYIDEKGALTQTGLDLVNSASESDALDVVARNLLLSLDCIHLVETLQEMKGAGASFTLSSVSDELRTRGFEASNNSSDLSGVLGWLRAAGVLTNYAVNNERYFEIVGASSGTIQALKNLSEPQVAFLRAMVALGVTDWTPHNVIVQHAEALYAGQVAFQWKELDRSILKPLALAGFIETQKAASTGRGGKPSQVKPTDKFERELAEPILTPIYKAAGFRDVRKIRSMAWPQLLADVKQTQDTHLRGETLEVLAIRICQLLDLEFYGWRETDETIVAGGEVDGFMHTARLVYSRWQIQCKASDKISYEAIAKEVGVAEVTLANVILIVSTGKLTAGARTYRERVVGKSPLNIIIIDGQDLATVSKNPAAITSILRTQAENAMRTKPRPDQLTTSPPSVTPTGGGGGRGVQVPEAEGGGAQLAFSPYYSTSRGSMYLGDSYDVLRYLIAEGVRVKLLFTSPPFALIRKKAYGNEDQDQYVDWFMRFAPLFHEILEPGGSFVMDIGGTWIPGIPARSVYQYKLLLRLCESNFYLAQEFYHYNPARLPTPAEWVTVRRLRVKDAMNHVWWFVKEPFVDSDNRRVLQEYSQSMKDLLRKGYKAALRPSGHQVSENFNVDHGGSIPSNLLQFANTDSNGHYLRECKRNGIKPHPARFPIGLPDFFIKFLTLPGETVLDPFAGSNVTGESAEALGRPWIGIELSEEYAQGSRFRFSAPETGDTSATHQPSLLAVERPKPMNLGMFIARAPGMS